MRYTLTLQNLVNNNPTLQYHISNQKYKEVNKFTQSWRLGRGRDLPS